MRYTILSTYTEDSRELSGNTILIMKLHKSNNKIFIETIMTDTCGDKPLEDEHESFTIECDGFWDMVYENIKQTYTTFHCYVLAKKGYNVSFERIELF